MTDTELRAEMERVARAIISDWSVKNHYVVTVQEPHEMELGDLVADALLHAHYEAKEEAAEDAAKIARGVTGFGSANGCVAADVLDQRAAEYRALAKGVKECAR